MIQVGWVGNRKMWSLRTSFEVYLESIIVALLLTQHGKLKDRCVAWNIQDMSICIYIYIIRIVIAINTTHTYIQLYIHTIVIGYICLGKCTMTSLTSLEVWSAWEDYGLFMVIALKSGSVWFWVLAKAGSYQLRKTYTNHPSYLHIWHWLAVWVLYLESLLHTLQF